MAGCFTGEGTKGLPCSSQEACGGDLTCETGICGGARQQGEQRYGGVEILFVVQNDESMTYAQERFATGGAALIAELDRAGVFYRIAFTTTDSDNPLCSKPGEAGALKASPCLDRAGDYVANEHFEIACQSACKEALRGQELRPTTITPNGASVSRPWLQQGDTKDNLPELVEASMADAFACYAPQGTDGCEFSQPLESMRLAMLRMQDPDDPAFGFYRQGDLLVVVFVTPYADCSHRPLFSSAFDPEGDRALWSDPEADAATLALCWNAGVECTNAVDGKFAECHHVNRGILGQLNVSDPDAVLYPIRRYNDHAQLLFPWGTSAAPALLVAGIVGVPAAFDGTVDDMEYRTGDNSDEWGVEPECLIDNRGATPPVRLRDFAAAADLERAPTFMSICDTSLRDSMDRLGERIIDVISEPIE